MSILILALTVGAATEADAFNRSKTCIWASDADPEAPSAAPRCGPGDVSNPFFWADTEVDFVIYRMGFEGFREDDGTITAELEDAIRTSFYQWNEPECSRFEFVYQGRTDVAEHDNGDETNIVSWRDPWPYTAGAYAVTSVTARPDGEIVDADLELNTAEYTFTNSDDPESTVVDIRNTVTHEAGHFLGLDHTPVEHATMQFDAPIGEISKRDLHQDDVEGICTIYPADEDDPVDPDPDVGCCSQTGGAGTGPAWGLVLGLLFAASLRRRRD